MARFSGIKPKMTAAIVAAVVATAASLTIVTTVLISYAFAVSQRARAEETGKILTEVLANDARQLGLQADVVSRDTDFQAAYAFRVDEPKALQRQLAARVEAAGGSLGAIGDPNGALVASQPEPSSGNDLARQLANSEALRRARAEDALTTTIEALGDQLFFVAVAPIKRYGLQTLGYLCLAKAFDAPLLAGLKQATAADVALVRGAAVPLFTTGLDPRSARLEGLEKRLNEGETIAEVKGFAIGGLPALSWGLPLRVGKTVQAVLVFAYSARDTNLLQRRVLGASLALALFITLIAGLVGLFMARRISDPIVEIENGFREIAQSGDLSRRITRAYPDEVGRMAESFNQMQEKVQDLHAQVTAAEQRMRGELQMASAVQEMLFPTTIVSGTKCEFVSYARTSTETGGDWCSIIHSPDHHTTTAIVADVTGHGAPAALVTAILHGFFRAVRGGIGTASGDRWRPVIETVLRNLNQTIIESTRRSLVHSLLLVTFEHLTSKVRFVSAGHLPPLFTGSADGKHRVRSASLSPSSLIGDREEPTFAWGETRMSPGDGVILYTDGLIECTDAQGEMFGPRRLRRVLQDSVELDARAARDVIIKNANEFFGDAPPADDITLIVGRAR
jgi:serine phosphatase RsbU (regulator of sigma subunit)